jgi:hypothetical protein
MRNFLFDIENGTDCTPISPVRDTVKRISLLCFVYRALCATELHLLGTKKSAVESLLARLRHLR